MCVARVVRRCSLDSSCLRKNLDLGQFERFRRVLHTPPYRTLLGWTKLDVLSTLAPTERDVFRRFQVEVPRGPFFELLGWPVARCRARCYPWHPACRAHMFSSCTSGSGWEGSGTGIGLP